MSEQTSRAAGKLFDRLQETCDPQQAVDILSGALAFAYSAAGSATDAAAPAYLTADEAWAALTNESAKADFVACFEHLRETGVLFEDVQRLQS